MLFILKAGNGNNWLAFFRLKSERWHLQVQQFLKNEQFLLVVLNWSSGDIVHFSPMPTDIHLVSQPSSNLSAPRYTTVFKFTILLGEIISAHQTQTFSFLFILDQSLLYRPTWLPCGITSLKSGFLLCVSSTTGILSKYIKVHLSHLCINLFLLYFLAMMDIPIENSSICSLLYLQNLVQCLV